MKKQFQYTLLGAALLIIIEQGLKLIVNRNLDAFFPIVPPVLYFKPMFNRDYSWINSMFQLGVGKWVHIALVIGMLVFILLAYDYALKKAGGKYINVMFAFVIAGAVCSLIDKLFWGGSLDYILLSGFFTFDLKDVYINVFIGLFIAGLLFKNKALKQILDPKQDEKTDAKDKA